MLAMNHLPVLDMSGSTFNPRAGLPDWDRAIGNIEDAKVAIDALKSLVNDAVFLDEDAYSGALHVSSYHTKLQSAVAQIKGMEHEAAALHAELQKKDDEISMLAKKHHDAEVQISELKAELENNAVVFRMHYQEIMTRNEEIERLKNVVEGLQMSSNDFPGMTQ